ncbi:MAG: hypothetical protein U1C51_06965 [Candidatus Izemoplasmatales bacterium]|nr:hypothetical protein [Candidatus Izemoplasmatales bacterium]
MKFIVDLKTNYYVMLILVGIFNIGMIAGIVLLVLNNGDWGEFDKTMAKVFTYVLIAVIASCESYLIYLLVNLFQDLKSVRTNTFEEITGIIIRYRRNEGEDGRQINSMPTIQEVGSDRIIKLTLNNTSTRKNQTYTFIYLKHTKIGAVQTADKTRF